MRCQEVTSLSIIPRTSEWPLNHKISKSVAMVSSKIMEEACFWREFTSRSARMFRVHRVHPICPKLSGSGGLHKAEKTMTSLPPRANVPSSPIISILDEYFKSSIGPDFSDFTSTWIDRKKFGFHLFCALLQLSVANLPCRKPRSRQNSQLCTHNQWPVG